MVLVCITEDIRFWEIRLLLLLLLRQYIIKFQKISLNTLIGRYLREIKIKETSIKFVRIPLLHWRLWNIKLFDFWRSTIYYFIDKIHGIHGTLSIESDFTRPHLI